jgi:hypothetical protein
MNSVRRATSALIISFATVVPRLSAQQCAAPAHPYFDFQVETRAVFVPDSAVHPQPTRASGPASSERALVQFVVDSLGVPDTLTYKVLAAQDRGLAEAGRKAMARWRFRPATIRGCRVPQLVQTPLAP